MASQVHAPSFRRNLNLVFYTCHSVPGWADTKRPSRRCDTYSYKGEGGQGLQGPYKDVTPARQVSVAIEQHFLASTASSVVGITSTVHMEWLPAPILMSVWAMVWVSWAIHPQRSTQKYNMFVCTHWNPTDQHDPVLTARFTQSIKHTLEESTDAAVYQHSRRDGGWVNKQISMIFTGPLHLHCRVPLSSWPAQPGRGHIRSGPYKHKANTIMCSQMPIHLQRSDKKVSQECQHCTHKFLFSQENCIIGLKIFPLWISCKFWKLYTHAHHMQSGAWAWKTPSPFLFLLPVEVTTIEQLCQASHLSGVWDQYADTTRFFWQHVQHDARAVSQDIMDWVTIHRE